MSRRLRFGFALISLRYQLDFSLISPRRLSKEKGKRDAPFSPHPPIQLYLALPVTYNLIFLNWYWRGRVSSKNTPLKFVVFSAFGLGG